MRYKGVFLGKGVLKGRSRHQIYGIADSHLTGWTVDQSGIDQRK